MNITQQRLVHALNSKTSSGEALWKPTEVSDQFSLTLQNGTVLFDRFATENEPTYYKIAVLNKQGIRVDEVTIDSHDDYFLMIFELYDLVRRFALGAEQTERALLDELNTIGEVGGSDLDPIPF